MLATGKIIYETIKKILGTIFSVTIIIFGVDSKKMINVATKSITYKTTKRVSFNEKPI